MAPFSDFYAYRESVSIARSDPSFYALIMAAMRKADTTNTAILRHAYPEVWADLQARYLAPGGVLETDSESLRAAVLSGESSGT